MLPSLAGVCLFVLLPFADVVRRSFTTTLTGSFARFANYKTVFANQAFLLAAANTLRFTAVCLPVLIGLGLLIAVFMSRLKKVHIVKSLFLFPMEIPAAAVVLVWNMVFHQNGFLNGGLRLFGRCGTATDYMG